MARMAIKPVGHGLRNVERKGCGGRKALNAIVLPGALALALALAAMTAAGAQAQPDVEELLVRVGERVAEFYRRAKNVICVETSKVQAVDFNNSPVGFVRTVESELRIDTYRASGAGGQHVNTTDSAVRITHVPTGIVVACQNERSQHKNRASAFKQLKARLYEAELQKREADADAANAAKTDISWGHQIRSYVLQPYQLVKDLRTGVTSTSPTDVLDGDLDRFMAAALSQRVTGETVEVEDVE